MSPIRMATSLKRMLAKGPACARIRAMPLALVGRMKDAVVSVRADSQWSEGVAAFLGSLTDDPAKVARHIEFLGKRAAGRLPWSQVLVGATLPNGRPMPPSRRYASMLVEEELLPLYGLGGLRFSLDLHNPGNEAGVPGFDPEVVELAIIADTGYFTNTVPGSSFDPTLPPDEVTRQRAANGALLGDLVARLVDATRADFGYADIQATGWRAAAAVTPERVAHPAPPGTGPWEFLWSITVWGPDRIDDGLAARIGSLEITERMRADMDPSERDHYRIERRRLSSGALFLQYRFLFGSELRGTRAACDTPLAQQAGLRSTNLPLRA